MNAIKITPEDEYLRLCIEMPKAASAYIASLENSIRQFAKGIIPLSELAKLVEEKR